MVKSRAPEGGKERPWLWGWHSCFHALGNPRRVISQCLVTPSVHQKLQDLKGSSQRVDYGKSFSWSVLERRNYRQVPLGQFKNYLPSALAVHQGIALQSPPLEPISLSQITPKPRSRILVLDGVVDIHNLGALWRSAGVFGFDTLVVVQGQALLRDPKTAGVIGKTACGALEMVSLLSVTNLARTLGELKAKGFWLIGLAEQGKSTLEEAPLDAPLALVIGGEGGGLRRLTQGLCDFLCSIPSAGHFSTLNASVAGAIGMHRLLPR